MTALSGTALDFSEISTCIALAVFVVFALLYLTGGSWWRTPLGWSIAIERCAIVLLLAITLAEIYLPQFAVDFVYAEGALILAVSAGVVIALAVMIRVQGRKMPQLANRWRPARLSAPIRTEESDDGTDGR